MSSDGVASPPYPGTATNARSLYQYLGELRGWTCEQQAILRPLIREKFAEQLQEPDTLPDIAIWTQVSVTDMYQVLVGLRSVREAWDHILREQEDVWDSRLATKQRFNLLLMACGILAEAFVMPEVREMRQQQASDDSMRRLKLYQDHMKKVLTPPELQTPDDDEKTEQPADPQDGWFEDDEPA